MGIFIFKKLIFLNSPKKSFQVFWKISNFSFLQSSQILQKIIKSFQSLGILSQIKRFQIARKILIHFLCFAIICKIFSSKKFPLALLSNYKKFWFFLFLNKDLKLQKWSKIRDVINFYKKYYNYFVKKKF